MLTSSDFILAIPLAILSVLYWYTRQTSTGVSHTAAYIIATGWTISIVSSIAWNFLAVDKFSGFMSSIFDGGCLFPCFLMFRLVWNWEWVGRWREGLRRTRWSHRERKSMRVEASMPLLYIVVVSTLLEYT